MSFRNNEINNGLDGLGKIATSFLVSQAIDQAYRSEKLAGQILTGISATALGITVIAVPILKHLGIWATLLSNPVFLPVFATIVAILIAALIIGIILLCHIAYLKSSVNAEINSGLQSVNGSLNQEQLDKLGILNSALNSKQFQQMFSQL